MICCTIYCYCHIVISLALCKEIGAWRKNRLNSRTDRLYLIMAITISVLLLVACVFLFVGFCDKITAK